MSTIIAFLRYVRLKLLISSIRLIVRLLTPRVRAAPDAVLSIPSRDPGRSIRAHLYSPPPDPNPSTSATASSNTSSLREETSSPRPTLINFFGSGFALPHLFGADDGFCRTMAFRTGHIVLDVEYRVGPENPFPAAIHDVEDVVRHVLARPETYSAARLSVSGFSSGGALALVAPALFPAATFRRVVAFYPSVSMVGDPGARRAPVEGGPRGGRSPLVWTRLFREGYLAGKDPRDPRISPLYADTSMYPEHVLVVTAEYDVSATEAEEFARNADADARVKGRRVGIKRMRGCGHNFDKSGKYAVARDEAYAAVVDLLT